MDWLLKILQLIPVIAAGVNLIHSGATLETKTQMAQDALTIASQGAAVIAGPTNAQLVSDVTAVAQTALTATVTAIHNATAPVTPAPIAG